MKVTNTLSYIYLCRWLTLI